MARVALIRIKPYCIKLTTNTSKMAVPSSSAQVPVVSDAGQCCVA